MLSVDGVAVGSAQVNIFSVNVDGIADVILVP